MEVEGKREKLEVALWEIIFKCRKNVFIPAHETKLLFYHEKLHHVNVTKKKFSIVILNFHSLGSPTRKVCATLKDIFEKSPERIVSMPHFSQKAEIVGDVSGTKNIKGRLEVGSQYHNHIEPQTCVCVPIEDGMDVYSATQYIDLTQIAISEALKLPNNLINMSVRRLGGAYGAKISRSAQIACAAAVAAHLLNRPVRFIMTIEANMTSIGKRYACIADYDVDFDNNGKIQKLVNDYVEDSGCTTNEPSK